jgi:leader peptidase (prepilin peptidase)/N-methyltransferase
MAVGFLLGITIPLIASRFGKVMPADPGTLIFNFLHKPRFPKSPSSHRCRRLKLKWAKMVFYSFLWGALMAFAAFLSYHIIGASHVSYALVFLYLVSLCIAVDQQFYMIPDFFTIPLLLLGFVAAYYNHFIPIGGSIAGAIYAYILTTFCAFIMNFYKNAIFGSGDVKMLMGIGAWLGINGVGYTVLLGFFFFTFWALIKRKKAGAYGPAMGMASIFVLFMMYI